MEIKLQSIIEAASTMAVEHPVLTFVGFAVLAAVVLPVAKVVGEFWIPKLDKSRRWAGRVCLRIGAWMSGSGGAAGETGEVPGSQPVADVAESAEVRRLPERV
ncbi:hypothetical protein [Streptomyces sp. NPDC056883]|uniref:hypothetical protein n=1 Tax=Streptomyces sp. NPDC056883 TaxID=3345959 RepID=UPI00367D8502